MRSLTRPHHHPAGLRVRTLLSGAPRNFPVTFDPAARPCLCMDGMICSRHDDRIRKLLLGLLDDAEALRTEELIGQCPECTSWYEQQCSGDAFEILEDTVRESILSCSLPPRPAQRRLWLTFSAFATAACLVLVFGVHHARQNNNPASVTPPRSIARIDFENPSAVGKGELRFRIEENDLHRIRNHGWDNKSHSTPVNTRQKQETPEGLFSDGVEDGSLKGWSLHT